MNISPQDISDKVEEHTGYIFSDERLLKEAFTHRSYLNEAVEKGLADNERLEFFGDSVLSLFVTQRLFKEFPEKREGELSRMRAAIVDESALARSAVELGLGDMLRLGRGEELSGGRTKKSMLADAFEALIGALYLDGGADAVTRVIDRHYSLMSAGVGNILSGRDCKTEFQESAQSMVGMTPTYQTVGASGPDHSRTFNVVAFLGDELMGEGSGRSKKEAEQEAARRGLERLAGREIFIRQ
jgi:ribonuclease-3